MATRLVLICAGGTPSMRAGGFPDPAEPLDEGGRAKAGAAKLDGPKPASVWTSPATAARETAIALGLAATPSEVLRDTDHGAWTGLSFEAVHMRAPEALAAWLMAPEDGAPNGETLAAVAQRVEPWLHSLERIDQPIVAITHASVIRATIATALAIPVATTLRIDIPPLSQTILSFNRVWRLQELRG
ncbi:broad specificity phosphatase PhoE [Sphingomonas sp. PP-CE-3A-406]|uniref:histidine phosphatase family protein n=1 Tax=Sphingomonas sp. PP-CE-3A-406 TaxID=2135659 RepID=UPI000EF965F1|nr:histidine phosphatase family protein [Sphingomonas sp. PP-CE-3A-406]RMB55032.1 broad specificity phosphatase PhoE [Sphingomonas sp. PP-CE-3A-406]